MEKGHKMDLREIGIDGANWIRLAQDRVVAGFGGHRNEPWGSIRTQDIF
jgi:hypothetical protein